jgi:hypothetical protein
MDQFVARVVAAAEASEEALVDQVFETLTSFGSIAKTRGASTVGSTRGLPSLFEAT